MKIKKIFIIFIVSILLIISLNVVLLKNYDNYLYWHYNDIINALADKYPESEAEIIEIITSKEYSSNILNKYGIEVDTLKNISSYRDIRCRVILITSSFYLIILASAIIIYCCYTLKIKK